jgi:hypothetical protein
MTAIHDLIANRKGDRTFLDLEAASGMRAPRWYQFMTGRRIVRAPLPATILRLTRGLDATPDEVCAAIATDLGLPDATLLDIITLSINEMRAFPSPTELAVIAELLDSPIVTASAWVARQLGMETQP